MNHEADLRLQAYLDRELDPEESREVERQLQADPEARALYAELETTSRLIRENEPEFKLPETREFYWSKIERAILSSAQEQEQRPAPRRSLVSDWLLRLAAPAAAASVLLLAVFLSPLPQRFWADDLADSRHFQEIEAPLEDSDAFSFYSPTESMTVVWVGSFD